MTQAPFTGSPFKTPENPAGVPPPKRRGRPPGSTNRARKSLKTEIGGTLTLLNMAVQMTPVASDRLDPVEIEALSTALDEEAKRNPQFRKYLEYALNMTGAGSNLIAVVGIIGARRAARHGILPEMFDAQLGALLAMSTGQKMPQPEPEPSPFRPVPVEFPSDVSNGTEPVEDDSPIATPIQNPFGTSEVKVDES